MTTYAEAAVKLVKETYEIADRSIKAGDDPGFGMAESVQVAQVYALLDVAEALRGLGADR